MGYVQGKPCDLPLPHFPLFLEVLIMKKEKPKADFVSTVTSLLNTPPTKHLTLTEQKKPSTKQPKPQKQK